MHGNVDTICNIAIPGIEDKSVSIKYHCSNVIYMNRLVDLTRKGLWSGLSGPGNPNAFPPTLLPMPLKTSLKDFPVSMSCLESLHTYN